MCVVRGAKKKKKRKKCPKILMETIDFSLRFMPRVYIGKESNGKKQSLFCF